jgi:hypothetical protein
MFKEAVIFTSQVCSAFKSIFVEAESFFLVTDFVYFHCIPFPPKVDFNERYDVRRDTKH